MSSIKAQRRRESKQRRKLRDENSRREHRRNRIFRFTYEPVGAYTILTPIILMCALVVFADWDGFKGHFFYKKDDWSVVKGRIIRADVVRRKRAYRPIVEYAYPVQGRSFNGNRLSFGYQGLNDLSEATQIVSKYKEGDNVQVYVLKGDASYSVLEPFYRDGKYVSDIVFLIFFYLIMTFLGALIYLDFATRPVKSSTTS